MTKNPQNESPRHLLAVFNYRNLSQQKNCPEFQAFLTIIFPVLGVGWLAAGLAPARGSQLFLTVVTLGCSLPPPVLGTAALLLYLPACCYSGWAPSGWACFAEQHWELPQYQLWVHNTPACEKKRSPEVKQLVFTTSLYPQGISWAKCVLARAEKMPAWAETRQHMETEVTTRVFNSTSLFISGSINS